MSGTDEGDRHGLAQLIAERRAKAELLRAGGQEICPYSYPDAEPIAAVRSACERLEAGQETDELHRVAGRLSARRGAGGAMFLDLVDRSGKIQLHARRDVLGEDFERLDALDLGDLVGVDGAAMRARKAGEPTLRVQRLQVLGKALRPPPDKHAGLSDVETRYRKRELDLIASAEVRSVFIARAKVIAAVRGYLDDQGFIEVETPILQPLYGGALARPFTTHHNALDRELYLRIAPELYLKRLIVGGLERVYELGKDFRNEGISTKHNPEFTMIEWYEAYTDYMGAAVRLEEMLTAVAEALGDVRGSASDAEAPAAIDFSRPWRRIKFVEAVEQATGIDILAHAEAEALAAAVRAKGLAMQTDGLSWPQLADELLSKFVEPTLTQPTFVLDYPLELSPFARKHREQPRLSERWEAFVAGMEVANAFSELSDPDEQRRRFEAQGLLAAEGDEETQPYDELFVEALEQGMPPTGGVGLGIDRLVMALTGRDSIREVILFPAMRG
ncbi:MAG TPA: lysine--tRNA ligase [Solirubrobacteraceae bacterium]|jgi:lysyl-tRNA synthetase class 2